jgi:hypothetical protein
MIVVSTQENVCEPSDRGAVAYSMGGTHWKSRFGHKEIVTAHKEMRIERNWTPNKIRRLRGDAIA